MLLRELTEILIKILEVLPIQHIIWWRRLLRPSMLCNRPWSLRRRAKLLILARGRAEHRLQRICLLIPFSFWLHEFRLVNLPHPPYANRPLREMIVLDFQPIRVGRHRALEVDRSFLDGFEEVEAVVEKGGVPAVNFEGGDLDQDDEGVGELGEEGERHGEVCGYGESEEESCEPLDGVDELAEVLDVTAEGGVFVVEEVVEGELPDDDFQS